MKKIVTASVALSVVAVALLSLAPAEAQIKPIPPMRATPTFKCSVTFNGSLGIVSIEKANAVTVDKTKDVVAVVSTPNGKIPAAVCGSAFASGAVGTKASVSFTPAAGRDNSSWIYTCSASAADTTLACNPPK